MPELAFGYALGLVASLLLMALHIFLFQKLKTSNKSKLLQSNLKIIDSFWSFREGKIKPLLENSIETDSSRYIRDAVIIGIICSFFSWFGFLMQLIVLFSLRYLTKSRSETLIWNSDLVNSSLTANEIQSILKAVDQA